MNLVGTPSEWIDLIDTLVPDILELVVATWADMPPLPLDVHENPTTETLCRLLRQNRNSSDLPFQIQVQMVELDPAAGQDQGRMDIAFCPLVPRENVYFSLECKRLNVVSGGQFRSCATEYVIHGLLRFVKGQYAAVVRHGGMLAYVLDGNVYQAIDSVAAAVSKHHPNLGMTPPGQMNQSSIRPQDDWIKETHHVRDANPQPINVQHIFVPSAKNATQPA
jgi:hypothetical protein